MRVGRGDFREGRGLRCLPFSLPSSHFLPETTDTQATRIPSYVLRETAEIFGF